MRQAAVLWIHTHSTLYKTCNIWSHLTLEDVVVAFLAYNLQRTNIEDALLTILVYANAHYLKTNSIGETLLVNDIAYGIGFASLCACSRNIP